MAVVKEEEGGWKEAVLPLPVAGLMSTLPTREVSRRMAELEELAREAGCTLESPFTTLAFMALLVIPELKLSDRGLFDGKRFEFTSLFVEREGQGE
jgi:adenine deaminase